MSQNKTIIPGFDYEASGNKEYDNSTQYEENAMSGLYSRSGADVNRTYIAGSPEMVQPGQGSAAQPGGLSTGALRQVVMQDRVVVGCLFSISRGLLGEIFPLYLGKNIIGRSPKCDVCLKEMTVSPAHAILHIRKASVKKLFYRLVAASADSGIEPDPCLFKRCLRASADPAADKNICAQVF